MIAAEAGALDTTLADLTTGIAQRLRATPAVSDATAQWRGTYALAA
jgi:hypothetical protein